MTDRCLLWLLSRCCYYVRRPRLPLLSDTEPCADLDPISGCPARTQPGTFRRTIVWLFAKGMAFSGSKVERGGGGSATPVLVGSVIHFVLSPLAFFCSLLESLCGGYAKQAEHVLYVQAPTALCYRR